MIRLIYLVTIFATFTLNEKIKVDPNSSLFLDQYGRYLVFHGVNVVRKQPPFLPDIKNFNSNYSLTNDDLKNLRKWGFNLIRLQVSWQGLQPEKDKYNYTYIKIINKIVKAANKYGIKVLLVAHQNLFNKQFCGAGFPDWTYKKTNFPYPISISLQYDENGLPNRQKCQKVNYASFYLSSDLIKFRKQFFTNQKGLLSQFAKFWHVIIKNVKEQPNLIGYELLNQPIGKDYNRDSVDPAISQTSYVKQILPAFRKLYAAIKSIDSEHMIFYDRSALSTYQIFLDLMIKQQVDRDKQVNSYHSYCPFIGKKGQPKLPGICTLYNKNQIEEQQKIVKSLKIGGIISQFGGLSNSEKSLEQLRKITEEAGKYFRSWVYWHFKYFDDITAFAEPVTASSFYNSDGGLQEEKVRVLGRSYAYAICGKPIQELSQNGNYTLTWYPSKCSQKSTQLFLNLKHYPLGFSQQFSNCRNCRLKNITQLQIAGYYDIIVDEVQNLNEPVVLRVKPKSV